MEKGGRFFEKASGLKPQAASLIVEEIGRDVNEKNEGNKRNEGNERMKKMKEFWLPAASSATADGCRLDCISVCVEAFFIQNERSAEAKKRMKKMKKFWLPAAGYPPPALLYK